MGNERVGTLALGPKATIEEWDDKDFDFGDENELRLLPLNKSPSQKLKVPPSVTAQQASIHHQLGQVQKLKKFVEELNRLFNQNATVQPMTGRSKHVWEHAKHIINLTTPSKDDSDLRRPHSSASPSAFGELKSFEHELPPLTSILFDMDHLQQLVGRARIVTEALKKIVSEGTPKLDPWLQSKFLLNKISVAAHFISMFRLGQNCHIHGLIVADLAHVSGGIWGTRPTLCVLLLYKVRSSGVGMSFPYSTWQILVTRGQGSVDWT
jgi:hypothetical protein